MYESSSGCKYHCYRKTLLKMLFRNFGSLLELTCKHPPRETLLTSSRDLSHSQWFSETLTLSALPALRFSWPGPWRAGSSAARPAGRHQTWDPSNSPPQTEIRQALGALGPHHRPLGAEKIQRSTCKVALAIPKPTGNNEQKWTNNFSGKCLAKPKSFPIPRIKAAFCRTTRALFFDSKFRFLRQKPEQLAWNIQNLYWYVNLWGHQ